MAEKRARRAELKANTRQRLLDATIDVIAAKGFAGTTLAEVGRRAGMSRGIVNFHFASKERLLVATLLHLAGEYALRLERALARAGPDPAARLGAMIAVEFHPRLCTRRKLLAWRAFWAEAQARPAFRRLRDELDARYFREARTLAARLIEDGGYAGLDATLVARGLNAMTDGLWDEITMHPGQCSRPQGVRVCRTFLAGLFPGHFTRPR